MSALKIGIISDLHLDHGPLPKDWDWGEGDLLVLAGDYCGDVDAILPEINRKRGPWKAAARLRGNHDITRDRSSPNDSVFGGQPVDGFDTLVVACTLWADLSDPMAALALASYPEFASGALTAETVTAAHKAQVAKLTRFIDGLDKSEPVIVVTHFPPTLQMRSNRYPPSPADAYFATDLEWMIEALPEGSVWICGHTHLRPEVQVGGTRVIQHALGYPGPEREGCTGPRIIEFGG